MERVLVIGGGGYVGTPLCERLLNAGYRVTSLDTFWFGNFHSPKIETISWNIAKVLTEPLPFDLNNYDSIIYLACLSNDPSSEIDQDITKIINYDATVKLMDYIEKSSVQKLIYASSSSVYGIKEEDEVTEELLPNPLTIYSKLKLEVEKYIIDNFQCTDTAIVRPATVYGPSQRMRLDVVVNLFCAHAFFNKEVKIFGGNQYRPNLYIEDMIDFYHHLLQDCRPLKKEIYNFGGPNFRVEDIALKVIELCPHYVQLNKIHSDDNRSYRITSKKAITRFELNPTQTLDKGIQRNFELFKTWDKESWKQQSNINLEQMKIIINNRKHLD